eukprot:scaffold74818_cov73-Phaeocystis_antarctica.AAC.5
MRARTDPLRSSCGVFRTTERGDVHLTKDRWRMCASTHRAVLLRLAPVPFARTCKRPTRTLEQIEHRAGWGIFVVLGARCAWLCHGRVVAPKLRHFGVNSTKARLGADRHHTCESDSPPLMADQSC